MLEIFLGKDNMPDDVIMDVNSFIYKYGIPESPVSLVLLQELENATYLSPTSFIDRDGFKLPLDSLSSGMKALLEIEFSNRCICGTEIGQNAFELMVLFVNGKVYFDNVERFDLPETIDLQNIKVNGKMYNTVLDLENALWKE